MSTAVANRRSPFIRLLITETRLFVREPAALFWGIAFPLVLVVIFGIASGRPDRKLGGLRLVDVYVPVMMAFVLTVLALQALPAAFATYREKGVLRRMSTTPVSPSLLLGADVAVNVTVIAIAMVLIAVVARVAFNVRLPSQGLGFILALALGAVAMMAIGALVASVARTPRVAAALGTLLFFPMMFFAGLWVPRQLMPRGLLDVSNYTPLGATVASVQETMHGHWPGAAHLGVLAAYAVVLAIVAIRLFKWE